MCYKLSKSYKPIGSSVFLNLKFCFNKTISFKHSFKNRFYFGKNLLADFFFWVGGGGDAWFNIPKQTVLLLVYKVFKSIYWNIEIHISFNRMVCNFNTSSFPTLIYFQTMWITQKLSAIRSNAENIITDLLKYQM